MPGAPFGGWQTEEAARSARSGLSARLGSRARGLMMFTPTNLLIVVIVVVVVLLVLTNR